MLDKDGRRAARSAGRMFDDARVVQFHDPLRRAGMDLTRHAFHGAADAALSVLPPDDPLRLEIEAARNEPTWDAYLFYGSDARWTDALPRPESWIRHVGRREDGVSMGWIDDFATPLRAFDLNQEMQRLGDAWVAGRDALAGPPAR